MKKKGKFDPYAYLPLQRTVLNKRCAFLFWFIVFVMDE